MAWVFTNYTDGLNKRGWVCCTRSAMGDMDTYIELISIASVDHTFDDI